MDVSRETPDVTTKPKCYDLTNILVSQRGPTAWADLTSVAQALRTQNSHAASRENEQPRPYTSMAGTMIVCLPCAKIIACAKC